MFFSLGLYISPADNVRNHFGKQSRPVDRDGARRRRKPAKQPGICGHFVPRSPGRDKRQLGDARNNQISNFRQSEGGKFETTGRFFVIEKANLLISE